VGGVGAVEAGRESKWPKGPPAKAAHNCSAVGRRRRRVRTWISSCVSGASSEPGAATPPAPAPIATSPPPSLASPSSRGGGGGSAAPRPRLPSRLPPRSRSRSRPRLRLRLRVWPRERSSLCAAGGKRKVGNGTGTPRRLRGLRAPPSPALEPRPPSHLPCRRSSSSRARSRSSSSRSRRRRRRASSSYPLGRRGAAGGVPGLG
jgi:hypothetical protein